MLAEIAARGWGTPQYAALEKYTRNPMRRPRPSCNLAVGSVCAIAVSWVGFDDGGYFPPVWGWAALMLAWVAALALILRGPFRKPYRVVAFPLGLALVTVWEGVSLAWSSDITFGVENVLRDLVYVSATLAVVALGGRGTAGAIRTGVVCGAVTVCSWSTLTRLLPDRLGFYDDAYAPGRLYNPLGYFTAQGLLAAITMMLLAGVVATAPKPWWRGLAAGAMPVCALDCYFTLSRGALAALAGGLFAMLALDPRREHTSVWLLLASPWPVAAVYEAHRQSLLAGSGFGPAAVGQGHYIAAVLAAVSLVAALVVGCAAMLEPRVTVPRPARTFYALTWALVALAVVTATVERYGTPVQLAQAGYKALTAPPPTSESSSRLLSLSLNGRVSLWKVAWDDAKEHPVLGSGAGTFARQWVQERTVPSDTRWSHSLYLELLAETGLIGLMLLAATLLLPLISAIRARADPLVPALFGAYVAFLIHAGVDWDWQVPAIGITALWCASALLAIEGPGRGFVGGRWGRGGLIAVAATIAGIAAVGLGGSRDLSIGTAAADVDNYPGAIVAAHAATRWAPWSYLPWMVIGQAKAATGEVAGARAAFRTAIGRDPSRWDAWFALAEISTGPSRGSDLAEARRLNPLSLQIAEFCDSSPGPGCS